MRDRVSRKNLFPAQLRRDSYTPLIAARKPRAAYPVLLAFGEWAKPVSECFSSIVFGSRLRLFVPRRDVVILGFLFWLCFSFSFWFSVYFFLS
jgi:hypothetical protein